MSTLKVDTIAANTAGSISITTPVAMTGTAAVTGALTTSTITSSGTITTAGEIDAATLDISGNGDVAGQLEVGSLVVNGNLSTSGISVGGETLRPYVFAFGGWNGSALSGSKNCTASLASTTLTVDFGTNPADTNYIVMATTRDTGNTVGVQGKTTSTFEITNVPSAGVDFVVFALITSEGAVTADLPTTSLSDITDVTLTSVAANQILYWTGSQWANTALASLPSLGFNASVINAGTLNDARIAASNVTQHLNNAYTGHIETAANKTYTIDPAAKGARTITGFYIKSASGTCTANLKVGTDVVKAASVSSSSGDQSSLANTSVSVDDAITLVVSSNSSATDVIFSVEYTG